MLKGYKTIIFNVIMTLIMVLRMWSPESLLPSEGDVQAMLNTLDQTLLLVTGVGNLILRAVTSSPMFKKEPVAKE